MIFVDKWFWVAPRNQRDGHPVEGTRLLAQHAGAQLTTTNHVRGETWTRLWRRGGHGAAVGFLDVVDQSPRVTIVRLSEEAEQRALAWLRQYDEAEHSFVDAYKALSHGERNFHHIKVDDIDLRPIRQRLEARVRSHVLICMLGTWANTMKYITCEPVQHVVVASNWICAQIRTIGCHQQNRCVLLTCLETANR